MKFHLRSLYASRGKVSRQESSASGTKGRVLFSGFVCCLALLLFLTGNGLLANNQPDTEHQTERIRAIVNRLRNDLSIPEDILISIVPKNKRLISVEQTKEPHNAFLLSFEEDFLDTLDDSDLTAAIAHELGHVWIFTHHPYLQTELLANQIALKVVTKKSLERVYERVWKDTGTKRDIEDLLGE
jgi:hypothetical protein